MATVSRTSVKGPSAFRTISEAAELVGVPQHVLRFWETRFDFIAPLKRAGGRRFYRPQDILVLKAIRRLLHDEGLTIKGVQRLQDDQGLNRLLSYGDTETQVKVGGTVPPPQSSHTPAALPNRHLLADLRQVRARLDAVLAR